MTGAGGGEGISMFGVRHDAEHSLRVDRALMPGVAERRGFWCICGESFGLLYDNAAKGLYRAHRREAGA